MSTAEEGEDGDLERVANNIRESSDNVGIPDGSTAIELNSNEIYMGEIIRGIGKMSAYGVELCGIGAEFIGSKMGVIGRGVEEASREMEVNGREVGVATMGMGFLGEGFAAVGRIVESVMRD
ncbi:Hypothetical predicted protein [Octopus vulgaris]|uniref:Uncharacterized protein n=1 Tax=Octopus vulgaris TaxID=6645 RepID=A0AA36AQN9_OCTVU|nr:Hypothetical predicted protein [Octopus vulgaris]